MSSGSGSGSGSGSRSGSGSGRRFSREVRRLLRLLFRIIRRLLRLGVSRNLILAVVFFAFSRTRRRSFRSIIDGFDGSGS